MADDRKRFRVRIVDPGDLEATLEQAAKDEYAPANEHIGLPLQVLPTGQVIVVLEDAKAPETAPAAAEG